MMKAKIILIFAMLAISVCVIAQDTPNARQAKHMFLETYNRAFREGGGSMHYRVHIAGLRKTAGTVWSKTKKRP